MIENDEQQPKRLDRAARVLHEAEGFYANVARHRKLLTHLDTLTRNLFLAGPQSLADPDTEDAIQRILGLAEVRQGRFLASKEASWQAWVAESFN